MIVKYVKQVVNVQLYLTVTLNSREIINMFPDLTKALSLALSWILFKQGFPNCALL